MPKNIEQTPEYTVARSTNSNSHLQSLWETDINWNRAEKYVRRIQEHIYELTKRRQWLKVRNLQKLLARSYYAKVLAIREITQRNHGKNTPGIDDIVYDSAEKRWELTQDDFNYLTHRPSPVKRIFIPKQDGTQRPLGIPTIHDRIMQMIVKYALEPEWEAKFEPNSYGFRPGRSTMDAIDQIRKLISGYNSSQWILDADISKCFDTIDHKAILKRTPTFQRIIRRWLKAGVVEFGKFHKSESGTPQGGIISPLLSNIVLTGLEYLFKYQYNINLVRYADDFVVIANSKKILENLVIPKLEEFLFARRLSLNKAKTKIIHRNEGFNFLGFHIKYIIKQKVHNSALLISPPKTKISAVLQKIKRIFRLILQKSLDEVLVQLNYVIRGWTYYYRFSNAKKTLNYLNYKIFEIIWSLLKRRHPNKLVKWLKSTYFKTVDSKHWVLAKDKFSLFDPTSVPLLRYIKVNELYSPFDRTKKDYWITRLRVNT
jgi:RNA-directed DNA polymerase